MRVWARIMCEAFVTFVFSSNTLKDQFIWLYLVVIGKELAAAPGVPWRGAERGSVPYENWSWGCVPPRSLPGLPVSAGRGRGAGVSERLLRVRSVESERLLLG